MISASDDRPHPSSKPDQSSGTSPSGKWEPPAIEALQQLLPHYEMLGLLGRGGMGAVYKARQKSLKRTVAIKILPLDAANDELNFAERFKNEAVAMARLNHPGIVNVHDAGEAADGLLYFVMEHVEGNDLAHEIEMRGRLPEREVKSIAMQVCDALSYLHSHGIIHRDIKPANILLNAQGRVKVADFGLARQDEKLVTTMLTRTGTSLGTAEFMAPECRRAMGSVDHRADLYSLGVAIYQMLTGELPQGMFKMPSQILPDIDERFDDIVSRALEPKPADRYQSAAEMREALAVSVDSKAAPAQSKAGATNAKRPLDNSARPAKSNRSLLMVGIGTAAMLALTAFAFLASKAAPGVALAPHLENANPSDDGAAATSAATFAAANRDRPFVNTLGMKFVPVPITGGPTNGERVLFSIWETRVQDYDAFANETKRTWLIPPYPVTPQHSFSQEPTEAAVYLTWLDAKDFCAWLTGRERSAGIIGKDQAYRLPTDHEWSCAAGLGLKEDAANQPRDKHGKFEDVFPWGAGWPPPAGVGNFADASTKEQRVLDGGGKPGDYLEGYNDGYPVIAPVGSFRPNEFGLYDLAGNAAERCDDWFTVEHTERTIRNVGWEGHTHGSMASSRRTGGSEAHKSHIVGFRVVLAAAAPVMAMNAAMPPNIPNWRNVTESLREKAPGMAGLGLAVSEIRRTSEGTPPVMTVMPPGSRNYAVRIRFTDEVELRVRSGPSGFLRIKGTDRQTILTREMMQGETKPAELILAKHPDGPWQPHELLVSVFGPRIRLWMDHQFAGEAKDDNVLEGEATVHFLPRTQVHTVAIADLTADPPPATPVDDAFLHAVAAAPADEQVALVVAKIKELNVGKTVIPIFTAADGKITSFNLGRDGDDLIRDMSPVAAFKHLKTLTCLYQDVDDLSCLKGLRLDRFTVHHGRFTDMAVLREMPLKMLELRGGIDLDYRQLIGLQLERLDLETKGVSDISFVKDMPLKYLNVARTQVRDLSPLAGLPLIELKCNADVRIDAALLRSLPTLQKINGLPLTHP